MQHDRWCVALTYRDGWRPTEVHREIETVGGGGVGAILCYVAYSSQVV